MLRCPVINTLHRSNKHMFCLQADARAALLEWSAGGMIACVMLQSSKMVERMMAKGD